MEKMEKMDVLNFKIGQLAEMKTFDEGYRGAWFRCKVRDISWKSKMIKLEYYDFEDEEISWIKMYKVPPYGRKSKSIQKQLMIRPQYPLMYRKSQMPPVNLISEVLIIVDGSWKVNDLVDWREKDCYWSARVVQILNNDKYKIELPMPPVGEGNTYEAFGEDLRPSLNWSPKKGWTLPVDGPNSCSAQLIFPKKQGVSKINGDAVVTSSPLPTTSSSNIRTNSLPIPTKSNTETLTSDQKNPTNSIVLEELPKTQEDNTEDEIIESQPGKTSSSESVLTPDFEEKANCEDLDSFKDEIPLNIMLEDTLEASIFDLEELSNKIKWMKSILQSNNETKLSWKFESRSKSSS